MLLSDYKRVTDIDDAIYALHTQLSTLYQERLAIVRASFKAPQAEPRKLMLDSIKQQNYEAAPNIKTMETWAIAEYEALTAMWAKFDIKIPSYEKLKKRIIAARN